MDARARVVEMLDDEIQKLQGYRNLIMSDEGVPTMGRGGPGRPSNGVRGTVPTLTASGRKPMSPEAREKIRKAQKERWAKQRKTAGKKVSHGAKRSTELVAKM